MHSPPLKLVFWESTVGCNLECRHCRRLEVSKTLARSDLTTQEAFAFVESLSEMGRPILVLSGGEPLFRPDIFEIARYGGRRGIPVALATNGTLVDRQTAGQVRAAGIRRVSVSLDGADAETHDRFRGIPGSFDAALRGIQELRGEGISVQINSTVARHNVEQMEDLYRLCVGLGADALHIFMLVPVGCGVEIADDQMLSPEKYEEVLLWLYRKSREKVLHTRATCAPHYFRILREQAREEGRRLDLPRQGMEAMTKGCLAGSGVCFVSHKGEVFPCGYLPVTAGNIRTQRLREIWEHSAVFDRLRHPELLQGKCGLCEYIKVCMGCRARAFSETGDYMAEEPYCIYTPKVQRETDLSSLPEY